MTPEEKTAGSEKIMGIAAGIGSMFATAAVLSPLVFIVVNRYFTLDFSGETNSFTKGELIIYFTIMVWVFISCCAGGNIAARYSVKQEHKVAWILSAIIIVFLAILLRNASYQELTAWNTPLEYAAMIVGGFHTGAALDVRKKRKEKIYDN